MRTPIAISRGYVNILIKSFPMEYKRLYLPYKCQSQFHDNEVVSMFPVDYEKTQSNEKEIERLIKQGYAIASTAPVTASYISTNLLVQQLGSITDKPQF